MLEINKQSEKTSIISRIIQYGGENGILCTQNHNTFDKLSKPHFQNLKNIACTLFKYKQLYCYIQYESVGTNTHTYIIGPFLQADVHFKIPKAPIIHDISRH